MSDNSNTLEKITFGNISSILNQINRNFSVIQNSPLFKGIPGEQGNRGERGEQGNRGTSILIPSIDLFNQYFSPEYNAPSSITSATIQILLNNETAISDLARVYGLHDTSFVYGDLLMMSSDYSVWRVTEGFDEQQRHIYLLEDTGVFLSVNVNLWQQIQDYLSQYLHDFNTEWSTTHELSFKNYGSLVNISLDDNAFSFDAFQNNPDDVIYSPNILEFLSPYNPLRSAYDVEHMDNDGASASFIKESFHRYFAIDVNLSDKNLSGLYVGIKTTSVLGSLLEYQKLFITPQSSVGLVDSLPYGDRIPALVVMQNDNNSGILLGNHRKQIENENRSLADFAHIYRNDNGELVLNHSFSINATSTIDNDYYDLKISKTHIISSRIIKTLQDFVGVNLKTKFVTSYSYSTNSTEYPYRNIASDGALYLGNGVNNSQTLLDIDFKKIRFKRYNDGQTGFLTVDGDGYTSKSMRFLTYLDPLYSNVGWFLRRHTETNPDYDRFNIDYALNNPNRFGYADYIGSTIPTQLDFYFLLRFLWGDIDNINNTTQDFTHNIGLKRSYKNFSNTVLKTDLAQLFSTSRDDLTLWSFINDSTPPLYSLTDSQLENNENVLHIEGFPLIDSPSYTSIKDFRLQNRFIIGGREIYKSNVIDALKGNINSGTINTNREFPIYIRDGYNIPIKHTTIDTQEKFELPFSLISVGINSSTNTFLTFLNGINNSNSFEYTDVYKSIINHDYANSPSLSIRSQYNPLLQSSDFEAILDMYYGGLFRRFDGVNTPNRQYESLLPPTSILLVDYFASYLLPFRNKLGRKNVVVTEQTGKISNNYYLSKLISTGNVTSTVNTIDLSSDSSIESQIIANQNILYTEEGGNNDALSDHYLLTMKHFKFIIKLFDKFKTYIQNFVNSEAITNDDRDFLVPEGTIISWYPTNKKNQSVVTNPLDAIRKDRYMITDNMGNVSDDIELPKGWVPCVSGFILETISPLHDTGIGRVRRVGGLQPTTVDNQSYTYDISPVTLVEMFNVPTADKISTIVNTYTVPDLTNKFIIGHRPHHFIRRPDSIKTWIKDYKPCFLDVQRLLQRVGWTRSNSSNKIYDIIDDFADPNIEGSIYGTPNNYYMGLIRGIDKWYWEGYQNPRASYMNGLPKMTKEILRRDVSNNICSYYYSLLAGNQETTQRFSRIEQLIESSDTVSGYTTGLMQDRIQLLLNHFNYYDMMQSSIMGMFHNHGEYGMYKRYYNRDFTSNSLQADDYSRNFISKDKSLRVSTYWKGDNHTVPETYTSTRCLKAMIRVGSSVFTDLTNPSWNNENEAYYNNYTGEYMTNELSKGSFLPDIETGLGHSMISIPSIELMQLYKTPKRVSKDNYLYFVMDYSMFVEAVTKSHNEYSENVNMSQADVDNPNKITDDNVLESQNLKYVALLLEKPDTDLTETGYTNREHLAFIPNINPSR